MTTENWLNQTTLNLYIKENYFHHHAFEIINSNKHIRDYFISALNQEITIRPRIKSTKNGTITTNAIKAGDLNIRIRELLGNESGDIELFLEVQEENGVFYFATKEKNAIGGFDFAILNNESNLTSLRNLCFGELQYHDGKKRWDKFLRNNPSLTELGNTILDSSISGTDLIKQKSHQSSPLIVGEIQFGNWALAYRDFFKVLKADVQNNIDCLIYIVPTGNLEKLLSDGIVTYEKTVKIIEDFSKVINVPVWLIGLDVE